MKTRVLVQSIVVVVMLLVLQAQPGLAQSGYFVQFFNHSDRAVFASFVDSRGDPLGKL